MFLKFQLTVIWITPMELALETSLNEHFGGKKQRKERKKNL